MPTEMQKQKKHEKTKQHKSLKYSNPHFFIQVHEYDKEFQKVLTKRSIKRDQLKTFYVTVRRILTVT